MATFASSDQIGRLTYAAAVDTGGLDAPQEASLGDGATWIKTQADLHFPTSLKILDWYHVRQALARALRAVFPGRGKRQRAAQQDCYAYLSALLWHGTTEEALAAMAVLRSRTVAGQAEPPLPAVVAETIAYFQAQGAWLGDYQAWREAGYPVGSGLVERAVALVINRRMKRQGMRWWRRNATAVVALRAERTIDDFDNAPDRLLAA